MREKLNPHNKKVYEDILVYIRLNYKSEDAETEEVLNELLSHVLQAQRDGKEIESVTGEDYKAYADSIIDALPKRNIWKFSGILAVILLGITYTFSYLPNLIFNMIDGAPTTITIHLIASLANLLIIPAIGIGIVYFLFHSLQYSLFKNWPPWKEYGFYFLIGGGAFLIYMFIIFAIALIDIGPSFEIILWFPVLLGIILLAAGLYMLFSPEDNAGQYENK
ncbi:hypothetical protein [Salinicoccus sp. HZC-1]|uniref:hypothetical protein n=1 Tax=Salinicoccus sp. HZC-1 TaxID=3385497 RepID=UPI00398BBA65